MVVRIAALTRWRMIVVDFIRSDFNIFFFLIAANEFASFVRRQRKMKIGETMKRG